MRKNKAAVVFFIPFISVVVLSSCSSKGGGGGPANPCTGVNITVSGSVTNSSGPGNNDGSIAASAGGGSGFTFSINGGAFQSSGNFTGLAAGSYTITAKDSRGCTGSASFTVNANDPCASVSFTVSGITTNATPCLATPNGSITVTTSGGGSGFTFNLNGGAFQSSPTFNNLAANNYTAGAKENGGCVRTASVTVNPAPPGTLFAAVKPIIQNNCAIAGCHVPPAPTGGLDFTQDCVIVANNQRIKVRAVDNFGTINQMPPPPNPGLTLAERNAITNWVNAGGQYNN
jgi:hypothetical protein